MAASNQDETAQVLELVGTAYDAALDPDLWPSVLEQLCVFARAAMANLFSQDVVNHHASRIFTWGGDPYYHALYLEKYSRINPMFPKGLSFEPGALPQAPIIPLSPRCSCVRRASTFQPRSMPQASFTASPPPRRKC